MSRGDLFLIGVVALQSMAALAYAVERDWKQTVVWGGVAVSNVAYLYLART